MPFTSSPIAHHAAGDDLERAEVGGRLAAPCASASPQTSGLLGVEEERQPAVGHLGGQLDVLVAQRRDPHRDAGALGLVEQLQRLAQAAALVRGQRELEDAVVVSALAAQTLPEDVDDLAGAAQRLVVGEPVEALDHLRAGGAEADDRAAAGDVVEAGRGLGSAPGVRE